MKSLLIHSNNTTLLSFYSDQFSDVLFLLNQRDDIDLQLTNFIDSIEIEKYNSIFIKDSLSKNHLEYLGLRMAIHIRLATGLNFINTLPIIIISEDTYEEISKLSEYYSLLKTPGVYLCSENRIEIESLLEDLESNKLSGCKSIINFAQNISIKAPANYQNHSITNEWSIIRWSNLLNIMGVNIKMGVTKELLKTKNKFDFLLYYKLLTAKHPINETDIPKEDILEIKDINKEISVLYIDDDVEKGWDEIFCYLLYDVNKLNFEEFGSDFNDLNQTNIIENSFEKAKDFDIIILDLRLHEKDYNETNPQKLTGFRILEKIKEYNQGIQVFIFSASNKIWNLQALQEKGADGFIMKESPENSNDPNFTLNSIKNIISKFDVGVKKTFLKDLFKIINPIVIDLNKMIDNNNNNLNVNILIDIKEQFTFFKKALYAFPHNLEWPFSILILIIERKIKNLYFNEGSDSVVSVNGINTKCNYLKGEIRYISMSPINGYENNKKVIKSYKLIEYQILKNEETYYKGGHQDPFNFRLTCVLFYVYGHPLDDSIFKFFKLYRLRSTDVMHAGRRNSVKVDHIELALNLVSILIK